MFFGKQDIVPVICAAKPFMSQSLVQTEDTCGSSEVRIITRYYGY